MSSPANKRYLPVRGRAFKGFLHYIAGDRPLAANILRQKVPKQRLKTLSKKQIETLIDACENIRDCLLIRLLYESALRIGEALALWLEDVDIPSRKLHVRDRGQLSNRAEIKTPASCRAVDVSADLINQILDYVARAHTDDVETSHLFLKTGGARTGSPLSYPEVVSLFVRLQRRTGIHASAHVLRHSSLTHLAKAGWKPEHLRIRAGHAHFQTTYQMYVHPSEEDIRQDWEETEHRIQLKRTKRRMTDGTASSEYAMVSRCSS